MLFLLLLTLYHIWSLFSFLFVTHLLYHNNFYYYFAFILNLQCSALNICHKKRKKVLTKVYFYAIIYELSIEMVLKFAPVAQ